jgi:NDP-sugar pyrophosphorylase family protein
MATPAYHPEPSHLAEGDLPTALPPICILAGGKGTRLGEVAGGVPKPLAEVAGEPFLVHQFRLLAACGANHVVLCVGHRGEMIEKTIGHERFGITVEYSYDSPGLDGTLGAVRRALALLGERFLVLYGDTYLPMDYQAADAAWRASSKPALMTVFRNEGRWDESNVVFCDGVVVKYDKSHRTADMAWIDYGFGGFTASTLDLVDAAETDLAGLQTLLADRGLLCGFEAAERFHEIGTPEALRETDEFLRQLRESKLG